MTGTMWHSYFEAAFQRSRRPVMTEVKLDRWLPEGWSGTADWLIWNDELKAFVLGDLKTIKGEGMAYIGRDGIKSEHVWQLSAYWYACAEMGIPLVKGFVVYYLPQNVPVDRPDVQPQVLEGMPLERSLVVGTMEERWQATSDYLAQVKAARERSMCQYPALQDAHIYLQPALAPVQERVQQVRWNGKQDCWDLKLVPHWSAAYCPYPSELCNCREQGQTKIGSYRIEFGDGSASLEYEPRKFKEGEAPAEDVTPTVGPTQVEFGRKLKEKENE